MQEINNKEGSYFVNNSLNQSTIISGNQQNFRSQSKRFHRTTQRSQSQRSFRSSKSKSKSKNKQKDSFYLKSNINIKTYLKKQFDNSQIDKNQNLLSEKQESSICKFNGILAAKSKDQYNIENIEQKNKISNISQSTPRKQPSIRQNKIYQQFYSQRKELAILQQIIQKQKRLKDQALSKNKIILKKLTQIQLENDQLKRQNQEKQKQLRILKIQINHLEAQNIQNIKLWKTIDILQMDKIHKQQQIRELLLFRQSDQKTILRLTEQNANYRKHKNHKLRPFPKASAFDNLLVTNNISFNDINALQIKLDQKQKQILQLTEQINFLSIKFQKQYNKIQDEKKKLTFQYQRKLTAISSSYRIAQRQLNLLRKSNNDDNENNNQKERKRRKGTQDFQYSLSPPESTQNEDKIQ